MENPTVPRLWTPRADVPPSPVARLLIDYLRRHWPLTPAELAARAGISRNALYHQLNGESKQPSLYLLQKLATATEPDVTLRQLAEAAGYPLLDDAAPGAVSDWRRTKAASELDDFLNYVRADSRAPAEMQAAVADLLAAYTAQRRQRGRGRSVPVDAEPPTLELPVLRATQPPAPTVSHDDAISSGSSASGSHATPVAGK